MYTLFERSLRIHTSQKSSVSKVWSTFGKGIKWGVFGPLRHRLRRSIRPWGAISTEICCPSAHLISGKTLDPKVGFFTRLLLILVPLNVKRISNFMPYVMAWCCYEDDPYYCFQKSHLSNMAHDNSNIKIVLPKMHDSVQKEMIALSISFPYFLLFLFLFSSPL